MKALVVLFVLLFAATGLAEEKKTGLKHESTLSYVQTGGNAVATTSSFKQMTGYWWTKDILKLTGHYLSTNTSTRDSNGNQVGSLTAENWSAVLRYEKVLSSRFNTYASHGWRGDRFQSVRFAHDSDIGGKYFWIKDDEGMNFFSELGYRYTKETLVAVINDTNNPKNGQIEPEYNFLRLFTQFDHKCTDAFSYGFWVEYLPSFDDFQNDYRVNFSPYITSVLSSMFSLKVAYEGRYRNIPAASGLERLDTVFTTSIIAKY